MAFMEATLLQLYGGQECVNRFYYQSTGTPAAASLSFLLTRGLGAIAVVGVYPTTKLMRKIADAQSNGVSFTTLTVKDMYSVTDFYSLPFIEPLIGQRVGDSASPTVAVGFRTNRVRSDIRRGTKRFAGVAEESVQVAGALTSAFITGQGAALALAMAATITEVDEGNSVNFVPVVLGKQRYDPDTGLPDPAGRAYRKYPTAVEQADHVAAGILWDIYPETRTQTSRQKGRGR